MNLVDMGRMLISLGAIMVLVGLGMMLIGKIPGLGKLPGDIFIRGEHGSFYFPIVPCLIISVVLSIILNLFHR